MRVTIWDLDYYFAAEKVNCFNPDVMLIASYHKQCGDSINFVTKEDDIRRPFDVYYVIKENAKTPNPPLDILMNRKIYWWGDAYKIRRNWKMSNAMLACRPDYMVYPEHNTPIERSEHVRLLGNDGKPLLVTQDISNTFKRKRTLVTDKDLWFTNIENLKTALQRLTSFKNVSFLHPIWLKKVWSDQTITNLFMSLDFERGAHFVWLPIEPQDGEHGLEFMMTLKKKFPNVGTGVLKIDYKDRVTNHWDNSGQALEDFAAARRLVVASKKQGIRVAIEGPHRRLDTPYFFVFEALSFWTKRQPRTSWLEYITREYGGVKNRSRYEEYWSHPGQWTATFRDLLRQTWQDKEFLLLRWKERRQSDNDIPWALFADQFQLGL